MRNGDQYPGLYDESLNSLIVAIRKEKDVHSVTRLKNISPSCTLRGSAASSPRASPSALLVTVDGEGSCLALVSRIDTSIENNDLPQHSNDDLVFHWSSYSYVLTQSYEPRRSRRVSGHCAVSVAIEPSLGQDKDIDAWYRKEHLDHLATNPIFLRCHRYEPMPKNGIESAPPARFLALHDYTSVQDLFDHSVREGPIVEETDWTRRVMDNAKLVERTIWRIGN